MNNKVFILIGFVFGLISFIIIGNMMFIGLNNYELYNNSLESKSSTLDTSPKPSSSYQNFLDSRREDRIKNKRMEKSHDNLSDSGVDDKNNKNVQNLIMPGLHTNHVEISFPHVTKRCVNPGNHDIYFDLSCKPSYVPDCDLHKCILNEVNTRDFDLCSKMSHTIRWCKSQPIFNKEITEGTILINDSCHVISEEYERKCR